MNKNLYLVFLLLFSIFSYSQYNIKVLNVVNNDIVYDENTQKIYAAIPSSNGPNGNSLGIINPQTAALESTVFIGSEPTVLAISDDRNYIYSGFSGASVVKRFVIASKTVDMQFGIGVDPSYGNYYAEDIEVMPGNSNVIAVSRYRKNVSPKHGGVAIIENGILKSNTTQTHTGSNKIEFSNNPNWLYGYCTESTESGLRRLFTDENGVSEVGVFQNILPSFTNDFIHNNNFLYTTVGTAIDVSNAPYVAGQFFSDVQGRPYFDAKINKLLYATYNSWSGGNMQLRFYNPTTFLLESTLSIPQSTGLAKNLISCGNDCYAISTSDNKIIILSKEVLSTEETKTEKIEIFPNPSSDFININSSKTFTKFIIYDELGRVINSEKVLNNKINIINLNKGIYYIELIGNNQRLRTKFIKK